MDPPRGGSNPAFHQRPSPIYTFLATSSSQMRWAALNVVVKGFKTSVPVSFLAPVLGFITPQPSPPRAVATTSRQQIPNPEAAGAASSQPLPGCRSAVYVGKAAPEAREEDAVKACSEWLKSYGAVLEGEAAGERAEGLFRL